MPYVRVNDANIFYHDDNFTDPWTSSDTVMLQHGLGRTGNMYYGWVPHLCRDYRVIRPHLRGVGPETDPGTDIEFSLDQILSDFLGMLDALGIDKVHYVGESLGSILGVILAARHPDRIKSLTLVSSIIRVRPEKTVAINSVGFPTWAEALEQLGMKEWWLRSRKVTNQLTGNAAKDDWFATECGTWPLHVTLALLRFASTVSAEPLLSSVKAPTLVLSAGNSPHSGQEEQQFILDNIAGSRQIVYPGAKHIDCFLEPDQFARDTCEFLRAVSASAK